MKLGGFFNENLITFRDDLMADNIPSTWFEIKREGERNLIVGSFYREWGKRGTEENLGRKQKERITQIFEQINEAAKLGKVLVGGDWNVDLNQLKENKAYYLRDIAEHFKDEVDKLSLNHLDFGITWEAHSGKSKSAIDYFLHSDGTFRNDHNITTNKFSPICKSDHKAIEIVIPINSKKNKREVRFFFRIKKEYNQ